MKTISYKKDLLQRWADPEYAAGYLTECFEEGGAEFLVGLRDVVEAHGGVGHLAKAAKLSRESLYRLLSEKGNPLLSSLSTIMSVLGIQLHFTPKEQAA